MYVHKLILAVIIFVLLGAHEDRGLGHDFLRHIERTHALLYVIDGAGTENREPADDLKCLVEELRQYDDTLLEKPSFVFCNKAEMKGIIRKKNRLYKTAEELGLNVVEGSALKGVEIGDNFDLIPAFIEVHSC